MTTPSPDSQPTRVIPQATAEQPSVTTAPATRRARLWGDRIPARIGKARTSTVVIGCLWVLLFALHGVVAPDPVEYTSITDANTGATIQVPASLVPSAPATTAPATTAPATTAPAESSSAAPPASTSSAPRTTTAGTPRSTTAAPSTTAERSTSTPREEQQEEPTTEAPTTSRQPATSAAETDEPEESSAPTS